MGQNHETFAPLTSAKAKEIELIIDEAASRKGVVVIDPDRGIAGASTTSLVNVNPNMNGQLRYGRHYGAPR